ncbi:MAG: fumarylacetoacetate hydrolase family protein [Hyphomicrobiaceae bacterium]|nr:fumarylacetoacetate hydrolase family protein [Hyphomicrobiaceae bacterium]
MKLLRYGEAGAEKPGLLGEDGEIRDLSDVVDDVAGDVLSDAGLAKLADIDAGKLPVVKGNPRLGPPVAGVQKFIGIGLNFTDHAKEAGLPIPHEPILFTKAVSSLSGPNDDIVFPPGAFKADWEVELAVIIGATASHVSETDALNHVAGYTVCNDVSERAHQFESTGDWLKGKSHDTWGPVGPWLVTRDEVPDPQALGIWLDVNGERMQSGSTETMIFPVSELVSYTSKYMTLHPGDIITTGTPPGVAMGRDPQPWLKHGDVVTLGVDGLGEQRQKVVFL